MSICVSCEHLNACKCGVQLPFIIERGVGGLALEQCWEAIITEAIIMKMGMTGTAHIPYLAHQIPN
eukprot:10291831-Ditylum_brightwellii.AAC.1